MMLVSPSYKWATLTLCCTGVGLASTSGVLSLALYQETTLKKITTIALAVIGFLASTVDLWMGLSFLAPLSLAKILYVNFLILYGFEACRVLCWQELRDGL